MRVFCCLPNGDRVHTDADICKLRQFLRCGIQPLVGWDSPNLVLLEPADSPDLPLPGNGELPGMSGNESFLAGPSCTAVCATQAFQGGETGYIADGTLDLNSVTDSQRFDLLKTPFVPPPDMQVIIQTLTRGKDKISVML